MLVSLKLGPEYDGLLYLGTRNASMIESHRHAELELNVVVEGTCSYVMNGQRFTFSQRTLLWLFPKQEHHLVDRSDNLQLYIAVFKPSLIERSCHLPEFQGLKHEPQEHDKILSTRLDPKTFDLICKNMDFLMEGSLDSDILNREAGYGAASDFQFEHRDPDTLNAGLHYLLLLCWRAQLAGKAAQQSIALHPAVRRALKILSESNRDQDLDQLAAACGASKSYLSRTFHLQVGVPINRYRNSLRLARFFEHYRCSCGQSLTDAVYAAGFGSYAQFYKVFIQAYGQGPRECLLSGKTSVNSPFSEIDSHHRP
jgi:AraC-like DNA-binding protein